MTESMASDEWANTKQQAVCLIKAACSCSFFLIRSLLSTVNKASICLPASPFTDSTIFDSDALYDGDTGHEICLVKKDGKEMGGWRRTVENILFFVFDLSGLSQLSFFTHYSSDASQGASFFVSSYLSLNYRRLGPPIQWSILSTYHPSIRGARGHRRWWYVFLG